MLNLHQQMLDEYNADLKKLIKDYDTRQTTLDLNAWLEHKFYDIKPEYMSKYFSIVYLLLEDKNTNDMIYDHFQQQNVDPPDPGFIRVVREYRKDLKLVPKMLKKLLASKIEFDATYHLDHIVLRSLDGKSKYKLYLTKDETR